MLSFWSSLHVFFSWTKCLQRKVKGEVTAVWSISALDHTILTWRKRWDFTKNPNGIPSRKYLVWAYQVNQQLWLIEMVNIIYIYIYIYLVGGWPTPLKNDGQRKSVGMMTFHSQLFLESHNPFMFQSPATSVCWFINHELIPMDYSCIYHKP